MSDKINANAPGYDAATPEWFYEQRIADLERQLAEAQAIIDEQESVVSSVGPITCRNGIKHDRIDDCVYCEINRLRAQLAERDAMLAEPFAYVYHFHSPLGGEHLSLSREQWNGHGPFKTTRVYTLDQIPVTAQANAKIIEAAEEQNLIHDSSTDLSRYLDACKRTCQAVRAKRELKP